MPSLPQTLTLGGRTISLGWCDIGAADLEALSTLERVEWEKGRTTKRRDEFLAGRVAAKRALRGLDASLGTCDIIAETQGPTRGRPSVVSRPDIALSISHSQAYAVAAARLRDTSPGVGSPAHGVGVDLEWLSTSLSPDFASQAFADGELDAWSACAGGSLERALPLALWAVKEAVLKVWGVGLRAPLAGVGVFPRSVSSRGTHQELTLEVMVSVPTPELPPTPMTLTCALEQTPPGYILAVVD